MEPVTVGILGCGTISDAYLAADDRFECFEVVACADLDAERASATAKKYDLRATDPDALIEETDVDVLINLTPPAVHAETCRRALAAGTHVYTEKPLAASVEEATAILETAATADRLVGAAPDTILGAGLQTSRSVIEEGQIGDPVGATAVWVSPGHEHWHADPDLFYREGGGPLFDMGPYYVTALVSLLGPARRVTGAVGRASDERTIQTGPREGEAIDVEVPTHEAAVVEFESGVIATVLTSFDAAGGTSLPEPAFEIYGTRGTLALPDPNHFEGPVRVRDRDGEGFETATPTHEYAAGRGAGVADLAFAIRTDWNHRTSGDLACHVLEILEGVRTAADRGEHVTIETTCSQPDPLPPDFPDEPIADASDDR